LNTSLSIETGVPVRVVNSHGFKKWFNIAIRGNSAIVTRYMLDSQFHCPYIESREVPEKNAAKNLISGDATSGDDPPHGPLQIRPGYILLSCHIYKRCEFRTPLRRGVLHTTLC
jgi:hypothetical protein